MLQVYPFFKEYNSVGTTHAPRLKLEKEVFEDLFEVSEFPIGSVTFYGPRKNKNAEGNKKTSHYFSKYILAYWKTMKTL